MINCATGVNLTLLKKNERPELKDYWTVNTNRLTNIATQLNFKGTFSAEEEHLEREREKAMIMCAQDFGVATNPSVTFENFEFLEQAVQKARRLHIRGTDGEDLKASKEDPIEKIVLGSDVATTTHGQKVVKKIKLG